MLLKLMALVTALVHMVSSQERGGAVLHQGEAGDTQSVIVTPRTRAFLSCESGDIVVKVNFTYPFRGLMYAHRSRNSPCRMHGTGGYYYELRIPLKGCGTWQESPRVFVNNITIRFHPALELEEDETKTVVCRYPPPLTQPPGTVQIIEPHPITPTTIPNRVATAKLSEVEILIIICLLLFLSLLTLGIGIAYFCLKRRNIRIVRKTTSSAPPSQITRLSSSNLHPPSSLLSSVLGHTVRIPRAVPYSAPAGRVSTLSSPDHHYEDYNANSSTSTETTSGEVSETSVSSSSLDQVDASRNLLYRKGGPKSILSIPKAILRKAGANRWRTQPTVHHYRGDSMAASTSVKRLEMEDQTVTTMLESENHCDDDSYWALKEIRSRESFQQGKVQSPATNQSSLPTTDKAAAPVYAQVDKNKKITFKQNKLVTSAVTEAAKRTAVAPGNAVRQVVTEVPEERKTSEEVTKNTTVTTSVRREVKETRVLPPALKNLRKDSSDSVAKKEDNSSGAGSLQLPPNNQKPVSALISKAPALNLQKPPKSILIRDVADIYLTTTVETELRELTTKVSRDVVEQHAKPIEGPVPESKTPKDIAVPKGSVDKKVPPETGKWNVVIRQQKPCVPSPGTDLDASGESNGESTEELEPISKPRFDVKIRTIPPHQLQPKKSSEMVNIPPLEMPETVGKLREALQPKTHEEPAGPSQTDDSKKETIGEYPETKNKHNLPQQRTVRWTEDTKDGGSTVSSSDSFQSSQSLRERSSSEVLEVAPTLPSQQRKNQPMLERSTSEIVTSPEDHSRWVGGVVPVLESLSPEFLANIPVVIQGGFFNRQRSPTPDTRKGAKKS